MSFNPLSTHFRASVATVSLPSAGHYYPEGALELVDNNVYPVYPMTMIDEITFKTPSTALRGAGLVTVIQSCIPNIKNAWKVPNIDIDAIITSIYIATYGKQLNVSSTCPECETEQSTTVDLANELKSLQSPDYTNLLKLNDLEITFKPMSYEQANSSGLAQQDEQNILEMIQDEVEDVDAKVEQLSNILQKITNATTKVLALNIQSVKVGNVIVDNQDHIIEWLSKCDRDTFDQVRNFIVNLKQNSELKPINVVCNNCQHNYLQKISLGTTLI